MNEILLPSFESISLVTELQYILRTRNISERDIMV